MATGMGKTFTVCTYRIAILVNMVATGMDIKPRPDFHALREV
jgi:hypothetical protein